MIDINASIVSYFSLGNIEIGRFVDFYYSEMYGNFDVSVKEYMIPFPSNEKMYGYSLNKDTLMFSTTDDGKIVSVGCNENYKGRYKDKLYPGISMEELFDLTKSRRILNGTLIVDEDYGLSFTLPSPYDEIADYIEHIPLNLKLNEIYVSDNSFWAPKK
ncbi:hypothetical protein [Pectobacterium parmentieri]|uniref:hypothetical protein n=1 Tax=Pectobacterium parmentieri TaxID=1905730 RepID=UPI000CDD383C|nr:hypothetical protein [Pectobacterium parmentieri]AYH04273.1 hypothetical protein C5E25_02100 [Pectobacterium parmentieri]AYH13094.1 hypothetical protein C5E23_02085 [Pectobacterium parmentieri]AYH21796.1 hypothetical protein C5E21_02080 [Pectobacterium parmentieri]MBN3177846.1 hypothetical protein [Pectobacterium parmentieri]POW23646.1 hypothetical protein PB20LOC_04357 [Pectobacterium parmentieri]